jgi:GxxExxY protein
MGTQRDPLTHAVIGGAIEVHRLLGPGLLESAYEACLVHELVQHGLTVERQVPVPVCFKDIVLDCGYRLDLLVNQTVIVEIKSVETLPPVHTAQLLTYLRFAKIRVGLLINFNVPSLRLGLKRFVI